MLGATCCPVRDAAAEAFAHLTWVAVAVAGANFEHMTWVSILLFGVWCMLRPIGLDGPLFWTYMAIAAVVISGVVIMSFKDCGVFEDAYNSVGPTMYGAVLLSCFARRPSNDAALGTLSAIRRCISSRPWASTLFPTAP